MSSLLPWYQRTKRDLPWRGEADPYAIWISEVMLQQTRVQAVRAHYAHFLGLFPTVEALAASELEAVLAAWSGLGYYRRARQLHRAAREVVERGSLPRTAREWKSLPGIGEYTAAAIASIAFNEPVAVVDGNVERVLCRLHALKLSPKRGAGRREVRRLAAHLLDHRRPGDWNQALMELGATVCTPRSPGCPKCPVAGECRALADGEPERFPISEGSTPTVQRALIAAVVQEGERVLLFRRPDTGGLLAGTWEVPWIEVRERETRPEQLFEKTYGGRWRLSPPLATVSHSITRYRFEVWVHRATLSAAAEVAEGREAGWFTAQERKRLPHSSLLEKIETCVRSHTTN